MASMATLSPHYPSSRRTSMMWTDNPDFKICILGYPSVGKTAITTMLTRGRFVNGYAPTVENSYQKTMRSGSRDYTVQILDTMGQEDQKPIPENYVRGTHGFLLVFDLNNLTSFRILNNICDDLCDKLGDIDQYPIFLVGNKSDEPIALREVSQDDYTELMDAHHITHFAECSARDEEKVETIFTNLVDLIVEANPPIGEPEVRLVNPVPHSASRSARVPSDSTPSPGPRASRPAPRAARPATSPKDQNPECKIM